MSSNTENRAKERKKQIPSIAIIIILTLIRICLCVCDCYYYYLLFYYFIIIRLAFYFILFEDRQAAIASLLIVQCGYMNMNVCECAHARNQTNQMSERIQTHTCITLCVLCMHIFLHLCVFACLFVHCDCIHYFESY